MDKRSIRGVHFALIVAMTAGLTAMPANVFAHGDVTPQAVDTSGLPQLGDEWLEENPWRDPEGENWERALEVGASGYNQNCARCHGLGAVSGGLAPDLRFLEADIDGDEWFVERFQTGYTQNGITKMPAFGELLSQEAAWAIRTFVETRPDEGAIEEHLVQLQEFRDYLLKNANIVDTAAQPEFASMKDRLVEIAGMIETGSGAPAADSVAARAAAALKNGDKGVAEAAEILTIGLSAAK